MSGLVTAIVTVVDGEIAGSRMLPEVLDFTRLEGDGERLDINVSWMEERLRPAERLSAPLDVQRLVLERDGDLLDIGVS